MTDKTINVRSLSIAQINLLVAKAEGILGMGVYCSRIGNPNHLSISHQEYGIRTQYSPATNGQQAMDLINKRKPWLSPPVEDDDSGDPDGWDAELYDAAGESSAHAIGYQTCQLAVCAAIIIEKFGEEIDLRELEV